MKLLKNLGQLNLILLIGIVKLIGGELELEYQNAIKSTKAHGYIRNPPYLISIVPWNPDLIWDKDKEHVLMNSLMTEGYGLNLYKPNVKKEMETSDNIDFAPWVTSTNEIYNFIKKYLSEPHDALSLSQRLNQGLGLPPSSAKKYFVKMWIKATDLFRPCLDPEVIDNTCASDPRDLEAGINYYKQFTSIPSEHYDWFIKKINSSYVGTNPFPWLRLGATYDWNPKSKDHIGFSEFVIKPRSTIKIDSVFSVDEIEKNPSLLIENQGY
jgi:hypothetical protein